MSSCTCCFFHKLFPPGGTEVDQPGQSSTMGAAASTGDNQSDDEDDKSLTSNYSTRNSSLWNNNKSVSLIDNPNAVSVQYLDLMNETSGYWTFDDSVKTRVSHVLLDQNEAEFESHDLTAKVLKLKDIVSHNQTESKSELSDSTLVESCDSGLNESHVTSETCESSYSDITSNPGDQIVSDNVKCNSANESDSSTDEDGENQITRDQDEKCNISLEGDCYPVEDGKNQIMSEENVKFSISTGSDEFSQTVDIADSDSLITSRSESESEHKGIDNMAANISEIARPVDVCFEQPKCDIDVENKNDSITNTDKSDSNLLIGEHDSFHNAETKIYSDLSQGDDVASEMSSVLAMDNGTLSENIDTNENDSLLAEKEPQIKGIDNLAADVTDHEHDGSGTSSYINDRDELKIIDQEFEYLTVQSSDNYTVKDEESDKTNDHYILNSESTCIDTHENNKGDVEITCDVNLQCEQLMSDENLSGDEVYTCKEPLDNLLGIYNENGSNISKNEITAFEKRENVKSIDDIETWDIDEEENTDDCGQVKVCSSDVNSEKVQEIINNDVTDESNTGALENYSFTSGRVFNKNLYTINEIEVVENNNEKIFSELFQGDGKEMGFSAEKSNDKFEQKLWESIEQNMTEICELDSHETVDLNFHHDHVINEQDEDEAHVIIEGPQLEDVCQCENEQKTSVKHHVCHKNCEVVQALFTDNGNHDISDYLNHLSVKDNQTSNSGNYKLETINESCQESVNPSNQFHDYPHTKCDDNHIDCDKTDNHDSLFEKENESKVEHEQTNHDWHEANHSYHDHQSADNHKNDSNHDNGIATDMIDKPVTNSLSKLHINSEELDFEEEKPNESCHTEISDNLKVLSDSKCNMCNLPDSQNVPCDQSCDKCVHQTKSHDDQTDCVHENNCHCHSQQLSSKNQSHKHSAEDLYDKHLSDVDFHNRKHFPDLDHSADDMSVEDGAYLTCSDNEQDVHSTSSEHEHGEHCSSMRYSQPESGFGETMSSDFNLTDKVFSHDGHLESQFEDLLEVENIEVPSPEESFEDCQYTNCHHDNTIDWDDGSICGCPDCLGRLRIERIITANKSTMCPDEAPYDLMCEICEELLENQLQKTEKDSKKKEVTLKKQVKDLKEENEKQQKIIQQNLQLGPEAKIEATMQHEITRLTSENLDLRESNDKNQDQIRKLKKMLKTYAKRLKDGEAAEIAAEMDKDDTKSSEDNVAHVKHRERNYMGMLEYRKEDEQALIKNLIMDLKPRVAVGLLPGLPAYVLFMCVRHTDYVNDDEKVRGLLTNTINGIKKCVKKHHSDVERVTLWLTNTCRLLHTLKQYSGEKAFQSDNSPRQNEHCLRNFDLSEYRQVFSDLAVWIYQTMIKQMQESVQQMIVPAVLEHEAIAGLTASKPSGMRGRSSSNANELEEKELSLDSLMKVMNKYSQILSQHAVDPELVKQIFRQLYYFVASGALNNLLLRKDMCNWSKGMQIRYNLSHLEQWLRDNKLGESGALSALEPITQASQLLQARKTDADVDSICEMCSKLTTPQIVKILNLYTPVDEFEERVPVSFIRKIQKKLQGRQEADNTLLMDTKYTFPVTFPFNPSSIAMETIDVPEQLHLGFLNRH
ncbi:fibrinogen-binding protein-like isoform X9 [Mytilus trossulus]|uniref:fibrinogen-binding protein-like isoform X9 n=1 Tax=Mytilus trossulus TaxID=6551 RepID=UPI00300702C5